MRTAGRHLLDLILAALGLLAAAVLVHSAARHGAALWSQVVLGILAYGTATAIVGRLLGTHPVDAITDSVTALALTVATILAFAGDVLAGIGTLLTVDPGDAQAGPASAPAESNTPHAKTA